MNIKSLSPSLCYFNNLSCFVLKVKTFFEGLKQITAKTTCNKISAVATALILIVLTSNSEKLTAQTIDVQYLNPNNIGADYKFLRLGNSSSYFGGLMYNINESNYGNGEDLTLFTYNNRDIFLHSGNGDTYFSKNLQSSIGIGTLNIASISQSSNMFPSTKPKVEIVSGTTTGTYQELMVLRHSESSSTATTRRLGFLFKLGSESYTDKMGGIVVDSYSPWANVPRLHLVTANEKRLSIDYHGKVGIGTENPDHELTVKGTIHSEEVLVDLNVPGPDYVFEEDYPLQDLSSLEQYLKANKHLPEVPSAAEMEKEGIKVGEIEMLLLKKVEELTLYVIEQDKEMKAKDEELSDLKNRLQKLERMMQKLSEL